MSKFRIINADDLPDSGKLYGTHDDKHLEAEQDYDRCQRWIQQGIAPDTIKRHSRTGIVPAPPKLPEPPKIDKQKLRDLLNQRLTYQQIADQFGVTRQRIGQLALQYKLNQGRRRGTRSRNAQEYAKRTDALGLAK